MPGMRRSSNEALTLTLERCGRRWTADLAQPYDLSIPLEFGGAQPTFFTASPATATPLRSGSFVGHVLQGGSVNCAAYSLIPHCNGTHTECVGHVTAQPVSVRDTAVNHLAIAHMISVEPQAANETA